MLGKTPFLLPDAVCYVARWHPIYGGYVGPITFWDTSSVPPRVEAKINN